jgi:zinc protease
LERRPISRRRRSTTCGIFPDLLPPVQCIAGHRGDVDTDDALERAKQHFDEIPAGPKPAPLDLTAATTGERRLLLEDRVELPRLYLSWHSPAMFTDGDAEMDLLSDLFANGKVSRLYKALVYERRIASEVMAFQNSRELGGFWQVLATAAPGHSLVELHQAIDDELARTDGRRAHRG